MSFIKCFNCPKMSVRHKNVFRVSHRVDHGYGTGVVRFVEGLALLFRKGSGHDLKKYVRLLLLCKQSIQL